LQPNQFHIKWKSDRIKLRLAIWKCLYFNFRPNDFNQVNYNKSAFLSLIFIQNSNGFRKYIKKISMMSVAPDIAATHKIILIREKEQIIWHLVLLGENVLFKESPPSIMVTRNPNWSTEILWYGTGYVKGKILSPLKRSTLGRLHCWFCLKLLNIYSLMLWWFVYNIPDSGASEYSISNNSNSGVGKNSPMNNSTMNNFNSGVGKKISTMNNSNSSVGKTSTTNNSNSSVGKNS